MKSFAFSIRIVSLCRHLLATVRQALIQRFYAPEQASGPITEASYAVSKKDFSKVHISLKENVRGNCGSAFCMQLPTFDGPAI